MGDQLLLNRMRNGPPGPQSVRPYRFGNEPRRLGKETVENHRDDTVMRRSEDTSPQTGKKEKAASRNPFECSDAPLFPGGERLLDYPLSAAKWTPLREVKDCVSIAGGDAKNSKLTHTVEVLRLVDAATGLKHKDLRRAGQKKRMLPYSID